MDPKIEALVKALIEKSKNKNAIWNLTNSDNQFKLLLPNNSYLTIGMFSDNFNNGVYALNIYNDKGSLIVSEEDYSQNSGIFEELFKEARTSYHKVDETIDGFLEALKTDLPVGKEDLSPKLPPPSLNDDDLPF